MRWAAFRLRHIAIHAVSSYSRDFRKAENPLKKITLGLLREAIRHNPEAIHTILHHVFNLPKNRQDEFSSLLQKTNLGNIISAVRSHFGVRI